MDIATITGVIGALTGIAGFIMGYVAYQHSKEITVSNRRLELEKLYNTIIHQADVLLEIIPSCIAKVLKQENEAGIHDSSYYKEYKKQASKDIKTVSNIRRSMKSSVEVDIKSRSRFDLDDDIIGVDRELSKIKTLRKKYDN